MEKELITNNKKEQNRNFRQNIEKSNYIENKKQELIINPLERESLKLSLVYPEFAEFFSHKKIENSSVKKILDLICEEIKTDDKSYGSKLIENNLLNEEEKEIVLVYLTSYMSLSDANKEKLYFDFFKDWFRIELNDAMKNSKEIGGEMEQYKHFKLRVILEKMEDEKTDKEFIKNLYKDFKNLV